MGCCATLPAAELLEKEIHYEQQVYRIQLAAPSHCYCLLRPEGMPLRCLP